MASAPVVTESADGDTQVAEIELAADNETTEPGSRSEADQATVGESETDGVSIPDFPELVPRHTATAAVMVRAGRSVSSAGDTVGQDELLAPLLLDTEADLDELILTANRSAGGAPESEGGDKENGASDDAGDSSTGTTVVAQDTSAVGSARIAASVNKDDADEDTESGEEPQDEDKEQEDEEERAENTQPSSGKATSSGG
jgi:hypothetical protein